MADVVEMFQEGGPFLYLVLAIAVAGIPYALVLAVLGFLKLRVPMVLWLVVPVAAGCAGLSGTVRGLAMVTQAAGSVTGEMRAALVSAGIRYALYAEISAWYVAAVWLLIPAWLVAGAGIARAGKEARWTPWHALAAPVLGLLGGIGLAVLSWPPVGLAVLCGGLAIGLAALRIAPEGGDAERVAAGRCAVATLAVLACGALALARLASGRSLLYEALAYASAETRQLLLATQIGATAPGLWGALVGAAVLGVAGLVAVAPVVRHLANVRTLVSGLVAFGALLVPALFLGFTEVRMGEAMALARPWDEARAEVLAEAGIELPTSTSARVSEGYVTVSVGLDAVQVEGERVAVLSGGAAASGDLRDDMLWPLYTRLSDEAEREETMALIAGPSAGFEGRWILEADRRLTVGQLRPVLRSAVGASFPHLEIATRAESGHLATITVVLAGPPAPVEEAAPELRVVAAPGTITLSRGDGSPPAGVEDPTALTRSLIGLKDTSPADRTLHLSPAAELTWGDLVALLDAVREDPSTFRDGRPRPLFPDVVLRVEQ